MEESRLLEVAVPIPVDTTCEYRLPGGMEAPPGVRVMVPYRGRQVAGFVLGPANPESGVDPDRIRTVTSVVDREPVFDEDLLRVVLQAARESLCPPGLALRAAIPPGTAPRSGRVVELRDAGRRALERGEARGSLGQILWSLGRRPAREEALRSRFPAAGQLLARLERMGWIRRSEATEPPRVRPRTERIFRLRDELDLDEALAGLGRAPRRRAILEQLADGPSPLSSSASLRSLLESGLVVSEEREVPRGVVRTALGPDAGIPELTTHQHAAVSRIDAAIATTRAAEFLLYGITGSGKTEVYLRATGTALEQGRSAIVLVPEISLTHQLVDRFQSRFGNLVAVLHSGLSGGERFDQWRAIRSGEFRVAIGARSAVFAPVKNLGLLVMDEEHDGAYKSEDGFRYHARSVAQLRSRSARCPLVLGSATPDLETSFRTTRKEIVRLDLPERIARRPLPEVKIVDMQQEPRPRGKPAILSRTLRSEIATTLAAEQQAILFLNRRGFARSAYCFACGHSLQCKHCDIALVYHASGGRQVPEDPDQGELRCHYCGFQVEPKTSCEKCGSSEGALLGFGTERVEEEIGAMFPQARIARLDADTSARRGSQRNILAAFHRRQTDILIGTQMVAKGHDVPGVTLVGVIAADLGLHFPDFRAGERTFQLLTQVAGRAGRGDEPGRVVIQTFLPKHYAVALSQSHDYPSFFREELRHRKPHGYPPYRSLAQLLLSGKEEARVEEAARELVRLARDPPNSESGDGGVEVLGPAPAPISRIRDRFRWQILLLGEAAAIREMTQRLSRHGRHSFSGITTRVDLSPLSML